MTRWTVFDPQTAGRIHANTGRNDDVIENPDPAADAVSSALSDEGDAIAILPAREAGSAVVASIHKGSRFAARDYQPTGFLGVHDQLFLEHEPTAKKKKWWERILD